MSKIKNKKFYPWNSVDEWKLSNQENIKIVGSVITPYKKGGEVTVIYYEDIADDIKK